MLIEKFDYQSIARTTEDGKRHYLTPDGGKLPSVTTILKATQPEADRKGLQQWRNRVGAENAQRITTEAAGVGTLMHGYLEEWIKTDTYVPKDNLVHRVASRMADTVIANIKDNLDEAWGTEVGLYYPELYAGTTDLAGVWKRQDSIMDFKQTNKPKKREWIEDYELQIVAYGLAHNEVFGTNICTGQIFMCSRACKFQLFEIDKDRFTEMAVKWAIRVEQFYNLPDQDSMYI